MPTWPQSSTDTNLIEDSQDPWMPQALAYAAYPWNTTGCEIRPPLTGLAPSYPIELGSGELEAWSNF